MPGTAFLAGLLLVGVLEAGDGDVDHAKIGVKFAIGLVILVLVMANLRKPSIPQGLYLGLLRADRRQHRAWRSSGRPRTPDRPTGPT